MYTHGDHSIPCIHLMGSLLPFSEKRHMTACKPSSDKSDKSVFVFSLPYTFSSNYNCDFLIYPINFIVKLSIHGPSFNRVCLSAQSLIIISYYYHAGMGNRIFPFSFFLFFLFFRFLPVFLPFSGFPSPHGNNMI